jgi:hypothetical protein
VIHELLTLMLTEVSIVFELLIGGPNQSHKVNFKELPIEGKVSANVSVFLPSINLPTDFSAGKMSRKEPSSCLLRLSRQSLFRRHQSKGRETVRVATVCASLFSKISQKRFGETSVERTRFLTHLTVSSARLTGRLQLKGRGT